VPESALIDLARDINSRCRFRGTFTLCSSMVSDEYFDKYLFESDPVLLRRVAERMTAARPVRC
jgi:orotate phosphoribosyltransferase